jgi:hypothetical protein
VSIYGIKLASCVTVFILFEDVEVIKLKKILLCHQPRRAVKETNVSGNISVHTMKDSWRARGFY